MEAEKITVSRQSLARLMLDMEQGKLRVPRFQREFVWERKRIQELLDSMYKEFPIGTIFLWDAPPEQNPMLREVEYLNQPPLEDQRNYWLILDGQQRLTSLYAVAKGLAINGERYDTIVADLTPRDETKRFLTRVPDNRQFVSVRDLINTSSDVLLGLPDTESQKAFLDYRDKLRDYPFSVVTVKDMELRDAVEIFERINRLGRRLTRYDLIAASLISGDFDFRERVEDDVLSKLDDSFGEISEGSIPQALALNIRGNSESATQLALKAENVKDVWGRTVECLFLAVDYLQNNLGVARSAFLPYESFVPLLAYYFFCSGFDQVAPSHRRNIEQWFWRATFSERFSANSQSRMSEDAQWIRDLVNGGAEYNSDVSLSASVASLKRSRMTSTTSALRNGVLCLLATQSPTSPRNGERIPIDSDYFSRVSRKDKHRVFPANVLKETGEDPRNVHLVPNFAFFDVNFDKWKANRRPSEYMSALQAENAVFFEKAMATNLVPIDESSGIWSDKFDRFASKRSALLLSKIYELCGLNDTIAPVDRNPVIDGIETALRNLIHETLRNEYGLGYWKTKIPGDIKKSVDERIDHFTKKTPGASKSDFSDSRAKLDFIDVNDYLKIVGNNEAWPHFSTIFRSRDDLETHLVAFRDFRNAVKHGRQVDELLDHRAKAAVIWLSRALELDLSEHDIAG